MAIINLSPLPSMDTRPDTFDADVETFFGKLPTFAGDITALQANLNSIAAGGAYAIPYRFANNGSSNGAGGVAAIGTPNLLLDKISAGGIDVFPLLAELSKSSSSNKGYIRLAKQSDPSKWMIFSATGMIESATYIAITGGVLETSHATPFSDNDPVLLFFHRTGDKGDMGSHPVFHVREEQAAGSIGTVPTTISAGVHRRPLNTVRTNEISGASLSSDQFSLPSGTYELIATGHGRVTTGSTNVVYHHKLGLYNISSGAYVAMGTNASSGETGGGSTWVSSPSLLQCKFTIGSAQTFDLRTLSNGGNLGQGQPSGMSQQEVYTDIYIKKVA